MRGRFKELHPKYNGAEKRGKHLGKEYREWRVAVFERDNYTCQKCNEKGGELNAHHICGFKDYPELRFEIKNGITFCKKCHGKFHKKYGVKNNTHEQLEEYISP